MAGIPYWGHPVPATKVLRRLNYGSKFVTTESELRELEWNEQMIWNMCLKLRGSAIWVWARGMKNAENQAHHMETARPLPGTSAAQWQSEPNVGSGSPAQQHQGGVLGAGVPWYRGDFVSALSSSPLNIWLCSWHTCPCAHHNSPGYNLTPHVLPDKGELC